MLMWFVIYPLLPICYVHMYICVFWEGGSRILDKVPK